MVSRQDSLLYIWAYCARKNQEESGSQFEVFGLPEKNKLLGVCNNGNVDIRGPAPF